MDAASKQQLVKTLRDLNAEVQNSKDQDPQALWHDGYTSASHAWSCSRRPRALASPDILRFFTSALKAFSALKATSCCLLAASIQSVRCVPHKGQQPRTLSSDIWRYMPPGLRT